MSWSLISRTMSQSRSLANSQHLGPLESQFQVTGMASTTVPEPWPWTGLYLSSGLPYETLSLAEARPSETGMKPVH